MHHTDSKDAAIASAFAKKRNRSVGHKDKHLLDFPPGTYQHFREIQRAAYLDAFALRAMGSTGEYGRARLWGAVGFGAGSLVGGLAVASARVGGGGVRLRLDPPTTAAEGGGRQGRLHVL